MFATAASRWRCTCCGAFCWGRPTPRPASASSCGVERPPLRRGRAAGGGAGGAGGLAPPRRRAATGRSRAPARHAVLPGVARRLGGAADRGRRDRVCARPSGGHVRCRPVASPRRPRVLGVELDDAGGELDALQARVSEAMVGAAGYVPEKRPFLAHVTVARVRRGGRAPRGELPRPPALRFTPAALILYR